MTALQDEVNQHKSGLILLSDFYHISKEMPLTFQDFETFQWISIWKLFSKSSMPFILHFTTKSHINGSIQYISAQMKPELPFRVSWYPSLCDLGKQRPFARACRPSMPPLLSHLMIKRWGIYIFSVMHRTLLLLFLLFLMLRFAFLLCM